MKISGSDALAVGNLGFMWTLDDIMKIVSIAFAIGYFAMAARAHFKKHPWRKKDAVKEGQEEHRE